MTKAEKLEVASARISEYNYRHDDIERFTRAYWHALKDIWSGKPIGNAHDFKARTYKAFYGRGLITPTDTSWTASQTPAWTWTHELKQLNKEVYRDRPRIEETVEQTRMIVE